MDAGTDLGRHRIVSAASSPLPKGMADERLLRPPRDINLNLRPGMNPRLGNLSIGELLSQLRNDDRRPLTVEAPSHEAIKSSGGRR